MHWRGEQRETGSERRSISWRGTRAGRSAATHTCLRWTGSLKVLLPWTQHLLPSTVFLCDVSFNSNVFSHFPSCFLDVYVNLTRLSQHHMNAALVELILSLSFQIHAALFTGQSLSEHWASDTALSCSLQVKPQRADHQSRWLCFVLHTIQQIWTKNKYK